MTAHEIRKRFLDFFASQGHRIIPSDSLVPKEDSTVLFTTAGMQQFKRQFLGQLEGYTRAASYQKCLRTDDLSRVGKTPHHHTFFEMLGNFSFGDYFKKEAIVWAWEFLTQTLGIPPERLWASVYKDDEEAAFIWLQEVGIPSNKLLRLGDKDNFWPSEAREKGPNGPCGPCSEIFYDYGVNPASPCPNPHCDPSCECGRFTEVWNLVFTQYNRKDGGILEPLPSKNIDTGMGLERLAAVKQGKKSNFETDLFAPIVRRIDDRQGVPPEKKYILADHIRGVVFAINDGIVPSNKDRGSVVKRLISICTDIVRRYRNSSEEFLQELAESVIDIMQEPYPELVRNEERIKKTILNTVQAYVTILNERVPSSEKEIQEIKDDRLLSDREKIVRWGMVIFRYYDTHGLTLDAIRDAFEAKGIADRFQEAMEEFQSHMAGQRERSRLASKMTGTVFHDEGLKLNCPPTEFLGYENVQATGKILKIFKDNQELTKTQPGGRIAVMLDRTPFYAEAGGQIGDTGTITHENARIKVTDTQKTGGVFLHFGVVQEGTFRVGDRVEAKIDAERRLSIMRNHTATHLLQAALRQVLGPHVQQQGSLVAEERLRFDFTHPRALTKDEGHKIEDLVNSYILACNSVQTEHMPLKEAKEKGALAFFAEKYADTVRVVSIDGYSKELCGGTHLNFTGQIGPFKITSESAVAQGIRRIEAVTGSFALRFMANRESQLQAIAQKLRSTPDAVVERFQTEVARLKRLEKDLEDLRLEMIKNSLDKIFEDVENIGKVKVITHAFKDLDANLLRKASDLIKQKSRSAVMVLASENPEGTMVLAVVTDDLIKKGLKANDLVKDLASLMKGSGGGRPELAQAGSKHRVDLGKVLREARQMVKKQLKEAT